VLAELQELMKGVNQGEGSSAYDIALLQSQIRNLAQEVRDLTISRPITILSGNSDSGGSLSSYILPAAAVGAMGYCYMWWKVKSGIYNATLIYQLLYSDFSSLLSFSTNTPYYPFPFIILTAFNKLVTE
jgi:hypothetical protein